MIDTVSGFAPFMWQNGVGPAVFVRNDLGPFGREMLLFCHDFAADILDIYADGYPPNIVEVCVLSRTFVESCFDEKYVECFFCVS